VEACPLEGLVRRSCPAAIEVLDIAIRHQQPMP
jgi:hypothetical protein